MCWFEAKISEVLNGLLLFSKWSTLQRHLHSVWLEREHSTVGDSSREMGEWANDRLPCRIEDMFEFFSEFLYIFTTYKYMGINATKVQVWLFLRK